MSKRFEFYSDEYLIGVLDTVTGKIFNSFEIVDCLNEQQTKMDKDELSIKTMLINMEKLEKENNNLKELIKGNVFESYKEGSLADLEFKAVAYDDIVKLEMSYESEPKVIVVCKQGKKENVKSFCQMFIPFGVHYEIKEVIG